MSKLSHSHQPTMDLIDARRWDEDGEGYSMDDEASIFAAHLLVPEDLLRADLQKSGPHDIDDDKWIDRLCKRYQVTRGLMLFRLRLAALQL